MTAKEYLNQIRKLDKLIENKLSELEHWRMVATGITSSFGGERVQTSGGRSKMEDAVCSYIDSQAELVEMAEELTRKRMELISTIEELPVAEYDLLYRRYVQDKDLYTIADELGKSYSSVTTLHGRALASVQKIINEVS